jgi:predicted alpha/beta-fold hydrolase
LRTLRRKALAKLARHRAELGTDAAGIRATRTLRSFDDLVTARMHGFRDAMDYWTQSSSKPWLKHIAVPTLVLNARDDPFLPASALPSHEQVSSAVTLEFPDHGGHVGFVTGPFPGSLAWLPQRLLRFIDASLSRHDGSADCVA